MTINFALSLSVEGIELLHRGSHDWRSLGRVAISSRTFDADMIALRQKAIGLAPDGVTSKLIIPADQIKYTAIDSTQTTQADIDAMLDGATPYALTDLVVATERSGGRTHIAAVAQDTLAEAEAFATSHGFNPVAFVAIAAPFTFQKEVFFGPTQAMPDLLGATATVIGDEHPVAIEGATPTPAAPSDFFARDVQIATPDIMPALIDGIPPEVYQTPAKMPAAASTPRAVVLAQPVVFDRIIAEHHAPAPPPASPKLVADLTPPKRPKSVLTAPVASRKQPVAASTASKTPLAVAAGLGTLLVIGVIGWGQITPTADVVPVAAVDPVQLPATPAVATPGPEITAAAPSGFGTSDTQSVAAPVLTATATTSARASAPAALFAGTADAAPDLPQQPPLPPVDTTEVQIAPTTGIVLSPDQAARAYATTGVWQRSPRFIDAPSGAIVMGFAAPASVAMPQRAAQPEMPTPVTVIDFTFGAPINPLAAETVFVRDTDGFVQATPEGAITPNGAVVFAGLPDLNINLRPVLTQAQRDRMALLAPAPSGVVIVAGRLPNAPQLRPNDLNVTVAAEAPSEPAAPVPTPGGVGLAGLELQASGAVALDTSVIEDRAATDLRPQLRPSGLMAATDPGTPDITDILASIAAEDATLRFDSSTALAVRASLRPNLRPGNFGRVVAAALSVPQASQTPPAAVATAAPVPPQNYAPVPGGVARAATIEDVIRLRDMNLIGVYGRSNARRALVRLSNGRYVRVEVGSALDGGQVTAIGDDTLNYVKRGRTYAVELPSG